MVETKTLKKFNNLMIVYWAALQIVINYLVPLSVESNSEKSDSIYMYNQDIKIGIFSQKFNLLMAAAFFIFVSSEITTD